MATCIKEGLIKPAPANLDNLDGVKVARSLQSEKEIEFRVPYLHIESKFQHFGIEVAKSFQPDTQ